MPLNEIPKDSSSELAARPLLGVRRTFPVMAQLMPL